MPTITKEYLSIKEVAEHIGISTQSVFKHIQNGALPSYKIGGSVRIAVADYKEWLEGARRGRQL